MKNWKQFLQIPPPNVRNNIEVYNSEWRNLPTNIAVVIYRFG